MKSASTTISLSGSPQASGSKAPKSGVSGFPPRRPPVLEQGPQAVGLQTLGQAIERRTVGRSLERRSGERRRERLTQSLRRKRLLQNARSRQALPIGVAGDEEHGEFRPPPAQLRRQRRPVLAGHDDVADQQVNGVEIELGERRLRAVRLHNPMPETLHLGGDQATDRLVVVDQEDRQSRRFGGPRRRRGGFGLQRRNRLLAAWQEERHRRPLSLAAFDPDGAAGLEGKTVHHREAEAGALSRALGREERVHRAQQNHRTHADAGIAD